jgi:NAD(P)-dependent dehydrogenase (short-subunit alcohol dehydrogenase family)
MGVADWPNAKRSLDAYDLSGKKALVVGAARGAGRAIALALAEAGADLALCTATAAGDETVALRKVAREVRDMGRGAIEQSIDASLGTGAQVMVKQVLKELGRIDVLVNAPDAFVAKPATRVSDADWAKVIAGNLSATFFTCRAVGREMLRQSSQEDRTSNEQPTTRARGRIINVASVLGERGLPNASAYCAAQAGILNLTRALAQEWAAQGITVNAIALGWMEGAAALGDASPEANQTVRFIPMKRAGRADEVGPLAVYLASDASAYVTGQVLFVDGGLTVHL